MSDILGNWPVTGSIDLINGAIVTGEYFGVIAAQEPDTATVSFFDSEAATPISISASVTEDGKALNGEGVVGGYRYLVTAMVETVGSPSMLYRTISGTVLRKGGGTEDSGGQWNGGPLRP